MFELERLRNERGALETRIHEELQILHVTPV
jgi:hypothetical protein